MICCSLRKSQRHPELVVVSTCPSLSLLCYFLHSSGLSQSLLTEQDVETWRHGQNLALHKDSFVRYAHVIAEDPVTNHRKCHFIVPMELLPRALMLPIAWPFLLSILLWKTKLDRRGHHRTPCDLVFGTKCIVYTCSTAI